MGALFVPQVLGHGCVFELAVERALQAHLPKRPFPWGKTRNGGDNVRVSFHDEIIVSQTWFK
jgi:hypothetical protein